MPDQVPPGVSRAFEVLVPAILTLIITACIGSAYYNITGLYLNDIIKNSIQDPLREEHHAASGCQGYFSGDPG